MLKGADVYAHEIMDQVLEIQPAKKQDRDEVRGRVRAKIVESWHQERDQICKKIKDGLKRLPFSNQSKRCRDD